PGDLLWSTNPSGAALRGLALLRAGQDDPLGFIDEHRRPRPRLIQGMTARLAGATAMMDVSDGVALDCWRLAEASGVGIALSDSHSPLEGEFSDDDWLYESGESFSLLVATPAAVDLQEVFLDAGLEAPKLIGAVTEGSGVSFRGIAVERRGYSHELG
ncbi:MAG: AIR synthase-related protein, partial [Actinobacteria bacterium]|nr:AIR synthase-related protein [Actinomycetota bacterium]